MQQFIDKLKLVLEYIWIILALLCLYLAIYEWVKHTVNQALPFMAFFFVALFFFVTRRKKRKNNN